MLSLISMFLPVTFIIKTYDWISVNLRGNISNIYIYIYKNVRGITMGIGPI